MIRRYDDIMGSAQANMIAKQDLITDFNEGSVIHTLLDTFARLLERGYVDIRQGYTEALRLIPFSLFDFQQKSGTAASGTVVFSRTDALEVETIIPKGTTVSGGGLSFKTEEAGSIPSGSKDSAPITIVAVEAGSSYNLSPGMITSIDSVVPSDVVKVFNSNATTGGSDNETSAELDERFKNFINGLSGTNVYAIKSAALDVDTVRSVSVQTHTPPIKDIYNLTVYVDDGSGSASEETIEKVKLAIEGDGDQKNGHLAPGINCRILAPQAIPIEFTVSATVYRQDLAEAKAQIEEIIQSYVNSRTIGATVYISEIIKNIMSLSYVKDVNITEPAENITPNADQIARFSSASIFVEEIA